MTLSGDITAADAKVLRDVRARGLLIDQVSIYESPGGSVQAAMEIGRMLRQDEAQVTVSKTCASACVLLYAGGVNRPYLRDGKLIIHNLYSDKSFGSYSEANREINDAYSRIVAYLRDMHISPSLADAMKSVPSYSSRKLSLAEAVGFGFTGLDPVYEEYMLGQRAAKLGISRPEMHRRIALRVHRCDPLSDSPLDLDQRQRKIACLKSLGLYP